MMKMITKRQWNALRYPIALRQLSTVEGGGWLATIPMLGEGAFMADGETPAEAIEALENLRRDLYEMVVESGQPIPLPTDVTAEAKLPSGKWIMRTPPRLHAELQEAAKAQGLSLNAYCIHCLERGHAAQSMESAATQALVPVTALLQQIQQMCDTVDRVSCQRGRRFKPNRAQL